MTSEKLLRSCFENLRMHVDDSKIYKLLLFMDSLLEYNKKVNLTSITDENDFVLKHIVDSLIMVNKKSMFPGIKVIDIGTGGGIPGIPIKILYPDSDMTLVDSVGKKIKFVDEVASILNIDVSTVNDRSENLGKRANYREKYDIVISRAVANMQTLCELCLPLVKIGGQMVTSKGPRCNEEIERAKNCIKILGGSKPVIQKTLIPYTQISRNIVSINKTSATPLKYPRKPGIPNKNPL